MTLSWPLCLLLERRNIEDESRAWTTQRQLFFIPPDTQGGLTTICYIPVRGCLTQSVPFESVLKITFRVVTTAYQTEKIRSATHLRGAIDQSASTLFYWGMSRRSLGITTWELSW